MLIFLTFAIAKSEILKFWTISKDKKKFVVNFWKGRKQKQKLMKYIEI